MHKSAEYAPGIPSKTRSHELPEIEKPTVWQFGVHDHAAERRGRHYDLRLGDPKTGYAHSWAMPAKWPAPGEKSWAIQQPTHTVKYMDFEGRIPEGYGKGDVKLFDRDKTEVTSSRPGHVAFNVYRSTGPEEYVLHRLDDKKWVLHNRTMTREQHPSLPDSKPKYKDADGKVLRQLLDDDAFVASAKIDDAHNLFYFPKAGEPIRVVSYRPSARTPDRFIEHTHKVPSINGVDVPAGLGGTIVRGGLYALHPRTGEATEAHVLAGLLNSDVWKSREKQKEHGELLPVLYDVVQYKGRKMESAPYKEKLQVLKKIVDELPDVFHLPRMAFSSKEKEQLVADIKEGRLPETKEGVVLWDLHEGSAPRKAKFKDEHDVYVRSFFEGEGKYKGRGVGGFFYSHTPDGPIAGKVGTGLTDEQRRDIFRSPAKYVGMVARVAAMQRYGSGALRSPSFQGWHLDKNDERLDLVKHASADPVLLFLWEGAVA